MMIPIGNDSWENGTAELPVFYLEEHTGLRVLTALLLSISAAVGSFGNLLVIVVILRIKTLRTCGNYFVLNLALADLIVTMLIDPFNVVGTVAGRSVLVHNPSLCEWIAAFCAPACMGSMWNMCAISLNRYVLICHHAKYARIFTQANTILMCVGIWILCHLFHLPNHVGWGMSRFQSDYYLCSFDMELHSYAIFYIITGVVIPLLGVLVGYAGIFRRVRTVRTQMKLYKSGSISEPGKQTRPRHSDFTQDDIKLVKTLFEAFAVFLACWALFAILVLAHQPRSVPGWVYVIAIIMAHGNSAVNPVIYGMSNDKFREGYKIILGMRSLRVLPGDTKAEPTDTKTNFHLRRQKSIASQSQPSKSSK
ncbi:melatonin receptor type 1A-like [Paramacrobiotus metropolitanus]|uniref:melatonin receptor type 1A-like n=1 Tax=Paramacrobiotus metropolitanus TaxID=2943436 RepID=UPI002445D6B7|nr:melatonin receptor type 1A-like [Paramacrobiotus metropolitanus]